MHNVSKLILCLSTLSLGFVPLYTATDLDLELIQAVKDGKAKAVADCLKRGADINVKIEGQTPLMISLDRLVLTKNKKALVRNSFAQAACKLLVMAGHGVIMGAIAQPLGKLLEEEDPDQAFTKNDDLLFLAPKPTFDAAPAKDAIAPSGQDEASKNQMAARPYYENQIALNILKKLLLALAGIYALNKVQKYGAQLVERPTLMALAVVKELIKDPNLDLTITNDHSQRALDIIHEYVCDNPDDAGLRAALLDVEQLVVATHTRHRFNKIKAN